MKNTIRLIGIITFIVIIGFSMITCDDGNGDDNGGGGGGGNDNSGGNSGAALGQETLTITDQQVYTYDFDETGNLYYTNYIGSDLTLYDDFEPPLGTAVITNGKLNYTQTGAPTGNALMNISDWVGNFELDNTTVSPNDVKCAIISSFTASSGNHYLYRGNQSITNYNANEGTGTQTFEQVLYIYVDKNVTITRAKVGPYDYDGYETTDNAINFSLTKGWNAITGKNVFTVTTTKKTQTNSLTKGDSNTSRWILWIDD
jgi:hypothetical protein